MSLIFLIFRCISRKWTLVVLLASITIKPVKLEDIKHNVDVHAINKDEDMATKHTMTNTNKTKIDGKDDGTNLPYNLIEQRNNNSGQINMLQTESAASNMNESVNLPVVNTQVTYLTGSESISNEEERTKKTGNVNSNINDSRNESVGNISKQHENTHTTENIHDKTREVLIDGPIRKEIDKAVEHGLQMMHDLYFIKEPLLYKMGKFLFIAKPARHILR